VSYTILDESSTGPDLLTSYLPYRLDVMRSYKMLSFERTADVAHERFDILGVPRAGNHYF